MPNMTPEQQKAWDEERSQQGLVIIDGVPYDPVAAREGRPQMTLEEYQAKQRKLDQLLADYRAQRAAEDAQRPGWNEDIDYTD